MSLAVLRTSPAWDRARVSALVPVGLILAVAVACLLGAVFTSAQLADEMAIRHDEELFREALADHRDRVLRELDGVVTAEDLATNLGRSTAEKVQRRVAPILIGNFRHDFVLAFDADDRIIYPSAGDLAANSTEVEKLRSDLSGILDEMRAEAAALAAMAPGARRAQIDAGRERRLQSFMQRAAIVASVVLASTEPTQLRGHGLVVVSVKLIDDAMLSDIAARLHLANLRKLDGEAPAGDQVLSLNDQRDNVIARFAWTPHPRRGEIVSSLVPLVVIALGALSFFAGFALRHTRRAAARISAGETKLRHLALHDPLSGLPNRAYFGERLEAVIAEVKKGGTRHAVFYLDLDHFKDVNDTLGHHVGDELIGAVTKRLRRILRDEALVARLGGDEFAVITSGATDSETLMAIADRMLATLCHPYSVQGHTLIIGASIGIAVIEWPNLTAADVMRYADMALYRAKNEGRRRACVYDAAMDADLVERKQMENDLRNAIRADELQLAYQPVFTSDGTRVVGVEALSRWNHSSRGSIPPADFIPVAEHSGLILPLGEWALRRACLDSLEWPISVAVNVSPLQFRRPDFVEMVQRILAETGFDPKRLELEITESTLLGNVEGAEAAMHRLKELGVRLALDDFGTGYSSLLYLRRFPFDKLKIDRSFIRNIEDAAEAAPIVHAIVSLGRGLGMKVTAEGVETAEQHLFLRAAGVHFMQGYRFGQPEPAASVAARLANQANEPESRRSGLARAG